MIGCFILGGLFFLAAGKFMRRHGACYGGYGRWGGHHGWRGHHFGHHGGQHLGHEAGEDWNGGRGWYGRQQESDLGPGEDDDGGGWRAPWARRGRGMPFFMRILSHRLETTPTQERDIEAALKQFRSDVEPLRGEAKKTRADLAAAMRKSTFDEVMLGELFARHDDVMDKGRRAVVGLGARLHDVLDERQRDKLATLIERGPRFGGPAW